MIPAERMKPMKRSVQKAFPAMGTVNTVSIEGEDALAIAERIKARILLLDRLWSVFRKDSEITLLNERGGQGMTLVSADTLRILKECVSLAAETNGAFDVTAGALTALWRHETRKGRLPKDERVRERMETCGADRIAFDTDGAVMLAAGQSVDLGGIAKGYAIDRAREIVKEAGTENALLNFGGSVCTIGSAVGIGIQNPFRPTGEPMGTVRLSNRCAVTSGSYERFSTVRGKRYHHIIDPRTGYPSESGLVSVTLIGENATALDALATGVFILGVDEALPILKTRGIDAIFVKTDGKVLMTEGLHDTFQLRADVRTVSERSKQWLNLKTVRS